MVDTLAFDQLSLSIEGMTCSACSSRLERAFKSQQGIVDADVNLQLERANVKFQPEEIDLEGVVDVVERTGFNVGTESKSFGLEGMTCANCASRAEKALNNSPGVLSANVNLALETSEVTYYQHVTGFQQLQNMVEQVGFRLTQQTTTDQKIDDDPVERAERYRLLLACVISVPFMVQMIAKWTGWEEIHLMPAAEIALATILFWIVGPKFFMSALKALQNKSANMDVLVSLGTLSAYLFSWFLTIRLGEAAEGELYFEAAVLIMTLVLLGKNLESRAKRATSAAIRELLNIRPNTVMIVDENGEGVEHPLFQLKLGDLFQCQAGQVIAADGEIVQGSAHVDEALVTGESRAIAKEVGDRVIEGSVNLDGYFVVRTTAVGEESTLQKIVKMIEQAQVGKTSIQRLVDLVSGVFVPVVMTIAALVIVLWIAFTGDFERAFINGVTVLVIACPCALGLATPTAVMTGVGAGARSGILFKDLGVLEAVRKIDTIVLDKTGTLTEITPALQNGEVVGDLSPTRCLQIAGSLQAQSAHPIAEAFTQELKKADLSRLEVQGFLSVVGKGVQGSIEEQTYYLGSRDFMELQGISISEFADFEDTVFLGKDSGLLAYYQIHEQVRSFADVVVSKLKSMGLEVLLLSGDSSKRVSRLAEQVGIESWFGKLLPEDKVSHIQEREAKGHVTAMIGDGINDAPALAAASIGIAVRSNTNVAMEVAPVTLMHSDLRLIPAIIEVSKVTFRKIKQNLFWAFIYNILMLPLAAFGFLNPTIAGAAMALSSVTVVLNSLWLRRWRPAF